MDINDEQRAEWQALADDATDGPWEAEYSGEQGNCVLPPGARSTREAVAVTRLLRQQADAEFIAAARIAVPALLAALRETEAELDDTVAELGQERWDHGETEAERDIWMVDRDSWVQDFTRQYDKTDAVRSLHRRFEIYESEDACPDTSDEHREEHHHEDSDGHMEYFCDQMYVYTACDHCRDEYGERVEWPCETIQALDGKN